MRHRRLVRPHGWAIVALCLALLLLAGCGWAGTTPGATARVAPTSATPRPDGLSADEAATLGSLEQVDGYPLYTMHFYGDYAPIPSPAAGAVPIVSRPAWGCSLLAALGDSRNRLYGRNFDWQFSPALLLFSDPADGYASVSMVDIAYLVDEARVRRLAELPLAERRELLAAPLLPFDGLNEQGLAIGMAAVPPGDVAPDPAKATVGSLAVIRLILDGAADVDEALAIFGRYNVNMTGGPPLHYLVADRSGRSLLVEFYQGEMVVRPNDEPWHLATNFLRAAVEGSAAGQCSRYDQIERRLVETEGRLSPVEALDLLAQVAQGSTQWSVVYGLSSGDVQVAMDQRYESAHSFHLPLAPAGD